jgi:hypothetical protein
MNLARIFLALFPLFLTPAVPATAADCAAAAAAAAQENGAIKVLSVKQEGDACVIVLLVPGQYGQAPRKITVRTGG